MSKRFLFSPALAITAILMMHSPQGFAQEVAQGKVVSTKLTHCDFKPGGCAGNLTLETENQGKASQLTINVPLGTPIRKGNDTVYLPALRGKSVHIVLGTEKGEKVARSIDVKTEKP